MLTFCRIKSYSPHCRYSAGGEKGKTLITKEKSWLSSRNLFGHLNWASQDKYFKDFNDSGSSSTETKKKNFMPYSAGDPDAEIRIVKAVK